MIPTFGINVNVHYCGGEISSISFGTSDADKCACGIKKMKKNCCEDKNFSFQVNDDQIKTQGFTIISPNSFSVQVFSPKAFQFENNYFPLITSEDYFHHPPNKVKPPLFLLHQVFRI